MNIFCKEKLSVMETINIQRAWNGINNELKKELEYYIDKECVKILSEFYSELFELLLPSIKPFVEEGRKTNVKTLGIRQLELDVKKRLEESESIQLDEQNINCLMDCFKKLLESKFFEEHFPSALDYYLNSILKKLSQYDESDIVLNIFNKSQKQERNSTFKVIMSFCKVDPKPYFDSIRLVYRIKEEGDMFEDQALQALNSFEILIEVYYRRLVSLILDLLGIIESKKPKLKVRMVGEAFNEYDDKHKYSQNYPEVKIFFDERIKNIRNAIAHKTYEIDVENEKILIFGRNENLIDELTEEDFNLEFKHLFRLVDIYFYISYYFMLFHGKKICEKLEIKGIIDKLK